MANNEIGKATIKVEADTTGVEASISTAKEHITGMGDTAEKSGGRIKGAFKGVSGAVEQVGTGASRIQETFSKMVIPVLFITGIAALADKVFKLRKDSEGYRDALKSAARVLEDQNTSEIRGDNLTKTQQEIIKINDTARQAEDAARKVFEDNQKARLILTKQVNQAIKDSVGVDVFGVEGQEEEFKSLQQVIQRIRKNQDDLIARASTRSKQEIEDAAARFEDASQSFEERVSQFKSKSLVEAGDFLGAASIELEINASSAARERIKLVQEIKAATKELGDEFDSVGKQMLANFDAMSKAQEAAIKRQAEVLQAQYFQPFIDQINNAFDTGFTTRLDAILNELQTQTDRARG